MAEAKRILFCIDSLTGGGAERIMQNTVNELAKDPALKISVQLLSGKTFPELNPAIDKRTFMKNGRIYRRLIKYLPARILHWLVVKGTYDVEVAFLEGASTKIISGCRKKGTRKIAWVHTDLERYPWSLRSYRNIGEERKAYARFDKVFAVSTEVKEVVKRRFDTEAVFIQNVIENQSIVEMSKTEEVYKDSKIHLVSVGSLKPIKGYDRLLRVHKTLKERGIDCAHYILGSGPEHDRLQKMIDDAGLSEQLILVGYTDNPYPWIKGADLVISASYAEGYSSVVSEAIILGTPVVTTDCAGMRDILGESEFGLIVENTDDALENGVVKLLTDRDLLVSYREKARERQNIYRVEYAVEQLKSAMEL